MKKFITVVCFVIPINVFAQTCVDNVAETTPNSRFNIQNNGTVNDLETGLIWMRCSIGQDWDGSTCTGNATSFSWREALNTSQETSFAEHTDWRLPNVKELLSIVEDACYSPSINLYVFPGAKIYRFWSSTPTQNTTSGNVSNLSLII